MQNPNRLILNSSTIDQDVFQWVNTACQPLATSPLNAIAWGDFDGLADGGPSALDLDLLYANDVGVTLYQTTAAGWVPTSIGLPTTGTFTVAAWLDYDNDGDLDLALGGSEGSVICSNDDSTPDNPSIFQPHFTPVPFGPAVGGAWAWADYDNDGDVDVFLQDISGQPRLYRNNTDTTAAPGTFLHIELVGTISNRSGIGAKIKVQDSDGWWHLREVEGGSGHTSTNSIIAEIGLGEATSALSITITWPSGTIQTLAAEPANQRLKIVEPTNVVVSSTIQYYPESNHVLLCPQGDAAPFVVTLDFPDSLPQHKIFKHEISMGIVEPGTSVGSYPEDPQIGDPLTFGDVDATAANGFVTTITKYRIGGCGDESSPVFLNGVKIGDAPLTGAISPDFHLSSPGDVDASDFGRMVAGLGDCIGDPGYDACTNFWPSNCTDSADLANFAAHFGHHEDSVWKPGASREMKTSLVVDLESTQVNQVGVDVVLADATSVGPLGVVIRPAVGRLVFREWTATAALVERAFCFASDDASGPRIVVLVTGLEELQGKVTLGRIEFTTASGDIVASDVQVEYEDYVTLVGDLEHRPATASDDDGEPPTPWRTHLSHNSPNPFNPITTIHYGLEFDGQVSLQVYDVTGRLVRTLVDAEQARGQHAVVWDGRDNGGRDVGTGVYTSCLLANGNRLSRRMVLLR